MEPLFWSLGIATTIYLSWNIATRISNKIAGFSTVGFWLFWTLGGSAWFGFSILTGPLFFVQMTVIIVVFYLSFKMWKNKNLINDLKKNNFENTFGENQKTNVLYWVLGVEI